MNENSEGFDQAVSTGNLTAAESQQFREFCPGTGYRAPRRPGIRKHPMWGPVVETRDAWALDPVLRENGSSGGVLTALAAFLLQSGEVSAVVGITASATDAFTNNSVVVREPSEVGRLAGSRYSPARPFESIRDLPTTERIAVVGKPCDIAGLRLLSEKAGQTLPEIAYFMSFFCAGTPSWKGTERATVFLGIPRPRVASVRYRGDGWPGRFTVVDDEGTANSMTYEESWGSILNKHLHTRCKLCLDGVGSYADIVAADSWQTDDHGYPLFEDGNGQSLVLTRTVQGERLVAAASSYFIEGTRRSLESLPRMQPSQATRKEVAAYRAIGYTLAGRSVPKFAGFARFRWVVRRPVVALRQLVGSYRRGRVEGRA
jgi:coenzyme F420 hydrogenase subunit beta